MALSKNIVYNSILTISNYLIPLVVFPYVSRTLGVASLGKASFIESIINFVLLFSMFGIYNLGIREIAKCKDNQEKLNKTFSSLFVLNAINTSVIFIIFLLSLFFFDKFNENRNLLIIGSFNLFFNLFLIQWFFVGIERFKFIVIRTIVLRLFYIAAVFVFVKSSDDYTIYYTLSVILIFINSLVNWIYSRRLVKFSFNYLNLKIYLKGYFYLGFYSILTSLYTTFNLTFLGLVTNNFEIGYYTTAIKIQSIFMGLFTAISTAIVPHMSSLVASRKYDQIKKLINQSIDIILSFGIPIVIGCIMLAPQIIQIIAGNEYIGSVLPLQIIAPTIVIIGLAQIVILQVLMPFGNDKTILRNTIIGAIVGLLLNFILVRSFGAIGAAVVWVCSEIIVLLLGHFSVYKNYKVNIFSNIFLKHLLLGIPYLLICYSILMVNFQAVSTIILSFLIFFIYFMMIHIFVLKNEFILKNLKILINKI